MGFRSPIIEIPLTAVAVALALWGGTFTQFYSAASPSTGGPYPVGAIAWNSSVTASTTPGWVCTTAGSPGVWTPMPVL
jgi:hypothetical protein